MTQDSEILPETLIDHVLHAESEAILNIPKENPFEEVVDAFIAAKDKGGKLVISGVGKAGEIATKMATTFCSVGLPCVFLHPLEAQHGDLGLLQKHDMLLLVSNSGKTREILELSTLSRRLDPALQSIALTGERDSDLAQESDFVLWTGNSKEVCPLGLTPTISTTIMAVIGDILTVLLMNKTGFTKEEYAKRHHSGYLGAQAKSNVQSNAGAKQ